MLEWFTHLNTEVQVALVALMSAISVTIIPLFKGKGSVKGAHAEIAGAIIDNNAINRLADSVDELVQVLNSVKDTTEKAADQLSSEISRHREEMIRNKK